MSSLMNSAMSGLGAAQAALNTVSNNIASYNVSGYTRQTTVLSAANSTLGAGGWVGNGVTVSSVQREYNAFITNQLNAAQNQSSGLTTRYQQMSKNRRFDVGHHQLYFRDIAGFLLQPANAGQQRRRSSRAPVRAGQSSGAGEPV